MVYTKTHMKGKDNVKGYMLMALSRKAIRRINKLKLTNVVHRKLRAGDPMKYILEIH